MLQVKCRLFTLYLEIVFFFFFLLKLASFKVWIIISPPNFFFQLQGILQRWVFIVCLQSVPVRVPSLVPSPQSPSLATHTLHCQSPQSDLRSFLPTTSVRVKLWFQMCLFLCRVHEVQKNNNFGHFGLRKAQKMFCLRFNTCQIPPYLFTSTA